MLSALLGGLGGVLFGASARAPISFGLLLLSVLCVGVVTTLTGALATAVQSWAVYSGFVLHRLGELRLEHQDRLALGCLLAAAVLAGGLARVLVSVLAAGLMGRLVPPRGGVSGQPSARLASLPGGVRGPRLLPGQGLVSSVTEALIPHQERPHRR